jgi:hypothetical protein
MKNTGIRSMAGRIMMGLALAAMIGGIGVSPVFADNGRKDYRKHDNRRYEQNRGYERNRHYYHPYGYRERVYSPVYTPAPAPGFNIFFPFNR